MDTTKDIKRREQADRQREVKKTLDTLSSTARLELNFVTEADTCIKHMHSVFLYFCDKVYENSNACADIKTQFQTLLNKVVDARSTIQSSYTQLCEVVRMSRDLPNAVNNREEINQATDVVLDGLLLMAQKASDVIAEQVSYVQTALMETTGLTERTIQSYKENETIQLKEGN